MVEGTLPLMVHLLTRYSLRGYHIRMSEITVQKKKKTLWKEIWELSWKSLWFLNKNKGTREGTEGLQYIFMMQPQTQLCPLPSVSQ